MDVEVEDANASWPMRKEADRVCNTTIQSIGPVLATCQRFAAVSPWSYSTIVEIERSGDRDLFSWPLLNCSMWRFLLDLSLLFPLGVIIGVHASVLAV